MVVYICDDLKEDLIRLKHFLKRYAKENGFVIRVHVCLAPGADRRAA